MAVQAEEGKEQMKTLEADQITEQTKEQGRRWGLFHRFLISDGNTVYIDRLTILTTPWFSIKLHRIFRPDNQRELHDHPWNFFSIVLLGWYLEDTVDGRKKVRWWNWKPCEGPKGRHSIREVSRSPVWTLVFTGPRRRTWGFWVDDGTRFVPWDEYDKLNQV